MIAVGVPESRRMRTRSVNCEGRIYHHGGETCCLCPTGYRVLSDCTVSNDTKCERCEPGSYTDHPNNDHSCQPCKVCNHNANMEEKEKCSPYSNTVCRCKKNHYCDKGEQCRACTPCDTCETKEVEKECTETNNTVCKDAKVQISNGVIAAAVLVPIVLIISVVLFCLWKRKKSRKTDLPEVLEPLKPNVDLNRYLPEIADHLSWKVMKRVAQKSGMTQAKIDNHERNHPNDASEQTNGLLQEWCQSQGLYKAYPTLINTLYAMKERRTADAIKEIVEK